MQIQLIVTLLIALVVIVLTIQNPNPVQMQFMGWRPAQGVPLIIVVIVSVLIGVITSALMGLKKQIQNKNRIFELEREVEDLRQLALRGPEGKAKGGIDKANVEVDKAKESASNAKTEPIGVEAAAVKVDLEAEKEAK